MTHGAVIARKSACRAVVCVEKRDPANQGWQAHPLQCIGRTREILPPKKFLVVKDHVSIVDHARSPLLNPLGPPTQDLGKLVSFRFNGSPSGPRGPVLGARNPGILPPRETAPRLHPRCKTTSIALSRRLRAFAPENQPRRCFSSRGLPPPPPTHTPPPPPPYLLESAEARLIDYLLGLVRRRSRPHGASGRFVHTSRSTNVLEAESCSAPNVRFLFLL